MANVDNPHGLNPLMKNNVGGCVRGRIIPKLVGESTAIFRNDAVAVTAEGGIEAGGTPGTTLWAGVSTNYGAASALTYHAVIEDPTALFEAQDDGDGSTFANIADHNLNANLIIGTGNTTTFISGNEIDISTKATTSSLDMKLLKLLEVENNNYGANARIVCMFNAHQKNPATAGI